MRKKTVRWTVFADVGNEHSEAIGALRRKNPFKRAKKKASTLSVLFSMKFAYRRVKSLCDEIRLRV